MVSLEIQSGHHWLNALKSKNISEMENYLQKINVLPKDMKLNDYRTSFFGNKQRKFECGESDRFLRDYGYIFNNGLMYHFNIDVDGRSLKEHNYV